MARGNGSMEARAERARRDRRIRELMEGRHGRPLPIVEVLDRVSELLAEGETLSSIRRLEPRLPPRPRLDHAAARVIREAQEVFAFDPRAWRLVGVDLRRVVSLHDDHAS